MEPAIRAMRLNPLVRRGVALVRGLELKVVRAPCPLLPSRTSPPPARHPERAPRPQWVLQDEPQAASEVTWPSQVTWSSAFVVFLPEAGTPTGLKAS